MASLAGRVALVTGGSRGIGAAIARELAGCGADIVVNYRENREAADRVVGEIGDAGGRARSICCDVSDRQATAAMFAEIERDGSRVDVVINNAGIVRDRTFVKGSLEDWQHVLGVNLLGAVNVCAAAVPSMIDRGFGRIVNVSSFVAQAGNFGQTTYAASKAGMIGFTRSLALEVARHGVTINVVCPGFIATEMWHSIPEAVQAKLLERIPLRRVGEPAEVAAMVRYLATEGAYVTGQTFNINGGIFIG